ncbi:DUF349 domain-containing protein [Hymenobacter cellulosivorans]|uniref:DUF349 domain-containing protein n=1 Tax=Hymenobacter cellulosivorans TaxID=2932249 RepID=A0ABY4FBD7_9BACT|nr:DUF349 domain-containing protein [Hymenobacter cellulosivorans]UOQ51761.1 DUF349 domain-containing protein [Hymenobacter cellulosivorans]
MLPENENTAPNNSDANSESPMSILERRLAEIQAKQNPADEAATPPVQAPAAPNEPASAPVASTTTNEITERPAQGTPPVTDAPGAGTAEPAAAVTEATADTAATLRAGEASESLTRAESHYGHDNPGVQSAEAAAETPSAAGLSPEATTAEASALTDTTPVTPEAEADSTQPEAVREPVMALETAADIETADAPVAALPTSNNESAAEAAEAAEAADTAHSAGTEEEEEYVPEIPVPDFTTLDLPAQAAHLLTLLRRPDARQNRKQIFDLYRQYETSINADRTAARQRFTEGGAEADDFAYTGPEGHAELTRALQEFRDSRAKDARAEDEQRAKNLAHKQYLLSQLRQLVESAETKDSSVRIKALQNDWKATGAVPQKEAQEIWNSYHALLDIYYNNRGLFFEMKELDRRRNLEAKEALIQRAEALSQQSSINKALQELRQLHEEWKHIGPVANEQRDAIWNRFLQASEKVHDRKKEFLNVRSTQENANLTRKTALLDQIKPFAEFQTERVNEWRAKTDELQKLKEEWDAAGLVPRDKAEQLNKQFWSAYKGFFQRKNQFFKSLDEEKNANLQRKLDLCNQAEAALQNPNWEEGREIVIRLQKEWKLIGRVPEKQSDKVWNRFRTACDAFFERKNEEAKQRVQQAQQVSQEQATHLDRVAEAVTALSVDTPGTLEGFRQHVEEWRNFDGASGGPRGSAERAEEKFQSLMGKYLDHVPGLSYAERADLLFQLQVERLKSSPDSQQALYRKEQALRREINELENDIATLQTNLEFFARSKNASQLREEYQGRIDEAKGRIDGLKKQLKIIRS